MYVTVKEYDGLFLVFFIKSVSVKVSFCISAIAFMRFFLSSASELWELSKKNNDNPMFLGRGTVRI